MSASANTRRPLQTRRAPAPGRTGGRGRVRLTERPTVSATITAEEMAEGLGYCADRYQETYNVHWVTRPDVLFVARRGERVVSTAALELGSKRPQIDAEKYFLLSPGMRAFIDNHRRRVVEFGRFASEDWAGTRAVVRASMIFARQAGAEFFFAFAPSGVFLHLRDTLGVPLCAVDVPVNELAVRMDKAWNVPPIGYFRRDDKPMLIFGIVPFTDVAQAKLDAEFGAPPSFLV